MAGRPEHLPRVPPLWLVEPAGRRGHVQFVGGPAARHGVGRVEPLEHIGSVEMAPGDVFVLAHSGATDPTILAQADQFTSAGIYNGNDAVALGLASDNPTL